MDSEKRSDYGDKIESRSFTFLREDGTVVRRRGGGRPMPRTPTSDVIVWQPPTNGTSPAERNRTERE